jgi:hypothetical protein
MATFAQLWDEYVAVVKVLDTQYREGGTIDTNVTAAEAAVQAEAGASEAKRLIRLIRGEHAEALITNSTLAWWRNWLNRFAAMANVPRVRDFGVIPYVYKYMHDNSEDVTYRNVTRGSVSWTTSANSASTSTVISVGTDAFGNPIEAVPTYQSSSADWVHQWECIADPQSTTRGRAVFRWQLVGDLGEDAYSDPNGSESTRLLTEVAIEDVSLLENADFAATFSGSGQDKVPGWYIDAQQASVTQGTTAANGYRAQRGTITPDDTDGDTYTLDLAYNATAQPKVYQYVTQPLRTDVPYLACVVFKGDGSADGNMTLTVGSQNVTAAVTTSYQIMRLPDTECWLRNFNADPLEVSIQRTNSPSAGTVYVHGVYLVPIDTFFSGRYTAILEDDDDYRVEDLATATDSVGNTPSSGNDGTSQYFWWRLCLAAGFSDPRYQYLPAASSASTDAHDYS